MRLKVICKRGFRFDIGKLDLQKNIEDNRLNQIGSNPQDAFR